MLRTKNRNARWDGRITTRENFEHASESVCSSMAQYGNFAEVGMFFRLNDFGNPCALFLFFVKGVVMRSSSISRFAKS